MGCSFSVQVFPPLFFDSYFCSKIIPGPRLSFASHCSVFWRHVVLRNFVTLAVFFGFSLASFGDQITLKNGDRFTGSVVKSDGKTLVLHTDAAGDVTIKFDAIQQITTDQELHVSLKDG